MHYTQFLGLILLLLLGKQATAQCPLLWLDGEAVSPKGNRIYLKTGQELKFVKSSKANAHKWYQLKPVIREYENLIKKDGLLQLALYDTVRYTFIPLDDLDTIPANDSPGTYYYCLLPQPPQHNSLTYVKPLCQHDSLEILQVIRRKDNTYFGYLHEQFNNPFIMPPRQVPDGTHQADACVGADCASFAIYGKRRQGYPIPYCGPHGIYEYLTPIVPGRISAILTDTASPYLDDSGRPIATGVYDLQAGDIVHFGEQVSVFYEDRGIFGQLDAEDLLIECYTAGPHIIPLGQSRFANRSFRIFKWKEQYRNLTLQPHHEQDDKSH